MPKLPIISGKQTVKTLEKMGFIKSRQTDSHDVLKKLTTNGEVVCVVPIHRELKLGTLKGVLKQAQINDDEFIANLK